MPASLELILGLLLLVGGGEGLVRGSAALARRLGVGPLVVGLTVVAFGTSAPELVVSVRAGLSGLGDIAVGNVVGSNIANIGLILGLAALLRPLRVQARVIRVDVPLMIGVTLLLWPLLLGGRVARGEGALLAAGLVGYVALCVVLARREPAGEVAASFDRGLPGGPRRLAAELALIVAGLVALAVGADRFVEGSVRIARSLDVAEHVIGLTLVAVGTSLPELATSVIAALRGEGDIAIGNVVGSNLFNVLGILGVAALLRPLDAPGIGAASLLAATLAAVALLPLARTGQRLERWEAGALLAAYAGFVAYLLA